MLASLLVLLASVAAVSCANADEPHFHQGEMAPYEIGPPSTKLSADDEKALLEGKTLMQAIVQSDGASRRLLMVKDIKAPRDVIFGRILDLEAYPRMVKGVDGLKIYESSTSKTGVQTTKAKYDIHALHLKFTYFMTHIYDPKESCMIFNLDYSRQSDIDDSIGYWYVQQRGPEDCRVYYSCVTKLRTWVPGPVYSLLTKVALEQTTQWVGVESLKEWERVKEQRSGGAIGKFGRNLAARLQQIELPTPPLPKVPEALERTQQRAKEWLDSHSPPWARKAQLGGALAGSTSDGGGGEGAEAAAASAEAAAGTEATEAFKLGVFGRGSASLSVGMRVRRPDVSPAFLPPHLRRHGGSVPLRLARAKVAPCAAGAHRRG